MIKTDTFIFLKSFMYTSVRNIENPTLWFVNIIESDSENLSLFSLFSNLEVKNGRSDIFLKNLSNILSEPVDDELGNYNPIWEESSEIDYERILSEFPLLNNKN